MINRLATLSCALAVLLAVANAAPKRQRRQSTCDGQITNCDTCDNPDLVCVECSTRQVLSSDKLQCINCPANCEECTEIQTTGKSECTTCFNGYKLASVEGQTEMQCLECGGNCISCETNGITKCDEGRCASGYRFEKTPMTCSPCTTSCRKCDGSEDGMCDSGSCFDKFALVSGLCLACGSHCSKCSAGGQCDSGSCDDRFTLNAVTKTCEACDPNCMKCSTPGKCDAGQCDALFALNTLSEECQACAPNCLVCSTPDKCDIDQCLPGFTLNSENMCTACPTNCAVCTIDANGLTACKTCFETYQKIENVTCDKCPENCRECEVTNGAMRCKSNRCDDLYALNVNDGTCHACPAKCKSCTYSTSNKKTMCRSGQCDSRYVARTSDGKCYKCPDFCGRCSDDGSSVSCIYGNCDPGSTYNSKTKKCSACPAQCVTCYMDAHDAVACSDCASQYALSADYKTCRKCPNNCNMCYDDNGNTKCYDDQCRPTYFFDSRDSQCKDCSIGGCLTCGTDANLQRICVTCDASYAMTAASTCSRCSDCNPGSCIYDTVTSIAKCSACNDGYALNSNGDCVACPSRCTSCSMDGASTTVTVCNNGGCQSDSTYIDVKTCVACPEGCSDCAYTQNGVFSCRFCMAGYTHKFGVCHNCPENCDSCDYNVAHGRTKCTMCSPGYVVNNNKCAACGTACSRCNTNLAGKCDAPSPFTFCSSGYVYSSASQTCVQCMGNCASCTAQDTCATCKTGYVYVSPAAGTPTCEACAHKEKCTSCVTSGKDLCDTCVAGYVINTDGTECLPCPDGCAACESSSSSPPCRYGMCQAGYVMDNTRRCRQCPEGCASCYVGDNDVTKCFMGYCKQGEQGSYVQSTDSVCHPCPSDCIHCVMVGSTPTCDPDGCINYSPMMTEGTDATGAWTGPFDAQGQCGLCDSNCMGCSTKDKCDSNMCQPTFYSLSTDTTLNTCGGCETGCDSCQVDPATSQLYCLTCSAQYDFDDKTANALSNCSQCDPNCATCTTNGFGFCDADQCDLTFYLLGDNTCGNCDAQCNQCTGTGQCSQCMDNYYESTDCNIQCDTNCARCDSAGGCITCMVGYGHTPTSENCTQCATGCDACTVAADLSTTCTTCQQEYYLDQTTGICHRVTCTDSTLVPVTTTQWLSQSGQSIKPNGDCLSEFNQEPPGCLASKIVLDASNSAYLTSYCPEGFCRTGFVWYMNYCQACPRGCGNCRYDTGSSRTVCKVDGCKYKYTRTSAGNCKKCPLGCNECTVDASDNAVCDAGMCDALFQEVAAKTCLACYDKCQSCAVQSTSNMLTCSRCNIGFVNVGTNCFGCGQECDTCTMSTATSDRSDTSCTKCSNKYARNSADNLCHACSDKCGSCEYQSLLSDTQCLPFQCDLEAGQNPSTLTCHGCPNDCLMCDLVSGTDTQMSCLPGACMEGFYHYVDSQGVGQCQVCVDFCMMCTDGRTCLDQQCMPGYGLNKDGTCTSCGTGCNTCTIDAEYLPSCLICMSEYVLNGAECIACPANCRECLYDSNLKTSVCKSGSCVSMFCQDTALECIACPTKSLGCEFNTAYSSCSATSCETGHGYITTNTVKTCSGCSSNCNKCTNNAAVCDECITRYTVADGACKPCSSNCHKCTKESECDSNGCDGRYVAHTDETTQKTTCKSCAANCQTCDTPGTCTLCDPFFLLMSTNSLCEACPDKCITCDLSSTDPALKECSECEHAYAINADKGCSACPGNCDSCHFDDKGKMVCDTCLAKYALNDGQCGNCPRNCLTCSVSKGSYRCTACAPKFALEELTGVCSACPTKCSECSVVNSEVTCIACEPGHSFDANHQCKSCPTLIDNCLECLDADESGVNFCTKCDARYALKDDNQTCLACEPSECQVCRDLPLVCSECATDYSPSDDLTECGMDCFACPQNGDCPSDPAAANHENKTWCLGVCKTNSQRKAGSKADWLTSPDVSHYYGCDNNPKATCDNTNQCTESSAKGLNMLECCCKGSLCTPGGATRIQGSLLTTCLLMLMWIARLI